MLPIHYGDQTATLLRLDRRGHKPAGIVLVKFTPPEDDRCPEFCGRAITWGRIWCPLLLKAINADRCKRMRRMSPDRLNEYLTRVASDLADMRRQKRQEREARDAESLRLAIQGKRETKKETGGKKGLTPLATVGPQATEPKRQLSKTAGSMSRFTEGHRDA